MNLNEYLELGEEYYGRGYATDGCSVIGWIVHRVWPELENACWSHDFARNGLIPVASQSENDNLFKDALKHLGAPRPLRFIMYAFTKAQGWAKDKLGMSMGPFIAALIILSLLAVAAANADQRFESWQGLCHFAYDPNDDDNEVYFSNCQNTINTYDAGDGRGRLAYGESIVAAKHDFLDNTLVGIKNPNLKGADADPTKYPDSKYATAANTNCVMVTSNYNAANDDNNETVYTTNDWVLDIEYAGFDEGGEGIFNLRYKLSCRGGVAQ